METGEAIPQSLSELGGTAVFVVLIASVLGSAVLVMTVETVRRATFGRKMEQSMIRVASQERRETPS